MANTHDKSSQKALAPKKRSRIEKSSARLRARKNRPSIGRLRVLAALFLCVVIAVVIHTHQFIIPLFLGLFTWGKVWIKSLTPKLGILRLKNSAVIQARRLVMQASTHIFIKSHRPWRRKITTVRLAAAFLLKSLVSHYLALPLWVRTAIAIGVLLFTAGSSLAVFALLIIPQPLLDWLEQRGTAALKKLGVTRLLATLWNFAIPANLRHRWHMHVKWTLGRKQLAAAKRIHKTVATRTTDSEGLPTCDENFSDR